MNASDASNGTIDPIGLCLQYWSAETAGPVCKKCEILSVTFGLDADNSGVITGTAGIKNALLMAIVEISAEYF
jgi:hypothetical protein